jgi:adenylate kinase
MTEPAADATVVIIAGNEGIGASTIVSETVGTGEMCDFNGANVGLTMFATGPTEGLMFVR